MRAMTYSRTLILQRRRADVLGGHVILAGGGDDKICGSAGKDTIHGGAGDDGVVGGEGDDKVDG